MGFFGWFGRRRFGRDRDDFFFRRRRFYFDFDDCGCDRW